MAESKVLLIGLGSIGQFHLNKLIYLYKHITVIEPDISKHKIAINNGCTIRFYKSLSGLKDLKSYNFAVIANWGPDHFETVNNLQITGVKKFLIEKPLCDSLWEVDKFEKLIKSRKISIISHFQWSYSYLPELIKEYSSKGKLGNPISIVVNGGAKCLATNGIHFLALANVIFNDTPEEDSMLIKNDYINPRRGDFLFLEGNATWKYPKSRYLSINFFNQSHNSLSMIINFKYGVGVIISNKIKIYSITESDRLKIDKPSKTKDPSNLLYQGEAFIFPDGTDGTDRIYKKIENDISHFDQMHLIQVTRSFLVALENQNRKKAFLQFKRFQIIHKRKKWKIS
jgi:hypothetical protein